MQHPPPRSTLFPYTTLFRSTERGIVLINDKTEHFVKSKSGKSDYDNISFVSNLAPIRLDNTGNNNAELQQKVNKRNQDRKSTRLNSSHVRISYAVFCLKKKK